MSLIVSCSECGKRYKVGDDKAGKKLKCSGCGDVIPIPAAESPAEEEVDLWELPAAEETRALPPRDLPRRKVSRKSEPEPAKPRRRSSGGGRSILGILVTLIFAVGGTSIVACGGWFVYRYNARIAAKHDAVANLPNLPWTKYSDPEGAFEAEFPGKNVTFEVTPDQMGSDRKKHSVMIPGIVAGFSVGYKDYPDASLTIDDVKRNEANMFAKIQGTVISRREITVDGHPATEDEFSRVAGGSTYIITTRSVLVKNRIFILEVVRPGDVNLTRETERFLNSFRILTR